jgi:hypothetical protein
LNARPNASLLAAEFLALNDAAGKILPPVAVPSREGLDLVVEYRDYNAAQGGEILCVKQFTC